MKAVGCPPPRFDATEVSVSCMLRAHPRFRTIKTSTGSDKPAKKKKRAAKTRSSKKHLSSKKKATPSPKRNRRG
jgi:ATP-dependent DNA helicase RecG